MHLSRISQGLPDAVVLPSNEISTLSDGRKVQGVEMHVDDEVFQQYVQGYRCIVCHAAQEEAFPERCIEGQYGCCGNEKGVIEGGYRIREFQSAEIARQYQGEKDLWPTRGNLGEELERERWKPKSGILLPGQDF
jgi:hypothetical protein